MATLVTSCGTLEPNQTYATKENAVKAVEKKYSGRNDLRYFLGVTETGRFFPVFLGEKAIKAGVFYHFNVVG